MNIRRVGVVLKRDCAEPARVGEELGRWLVKRGITVDKDRVIAGQDLLIVLGGDGTLLHVAAEACAHGTPVLGINLGGLGFLTEVSMAECYQALEKVLAGEFVIEERLMLKVRLTAAASDSGTVQGPWLHALNEVVISKGAVDRMAELGVWVDDEYLATYRADGLIIATSTGSTAYNLSAGGPIVHPRLAAMVVTPICPFMLESRPVLLAADGVVRASLANSRCGERIAEKLQIIVDGRHHEQLLADSVLEIKAAERSLQLVCSPTKGYFEILRNKLNWAAGHQK